MGRRSMLARTAAAVILLGCLLAAPGAGAAAGDALDELLMRFRQRQHGHVTFTESYSTAVLDRPLESSGELFYDAPDRLEKRTLLPRPQRLVVESGTLIIERRQKQYRVALADYPRVAPYIDSIRATLAGDRSALERVFRVEFSGSDEEWTLLLAPLDGEVAADLASIRIQGAADAIRIVTMKLANGEQSVMTLGTPADR
ncbi:MAG: LolA-related protein [Gammaproteobacteria bacterium]